MAEENSNYQYNETTGIVVPDTSKVKEQVQAEYMSALGEDLDLNDSTPQGRLIEAETVARKRTIENMALLANMFNPNQAYGIFLDSIASLFGVERVGATRTRVLCQITGTANTIIPAKSQAKDSNGNIYYLENQAEIGAGGTTTADFLSINKGAIECPANSLNQIVTAVLGWTSINNTSAGETGKDGEGDLQLRQQLPIKQYSGGSLLNAIKSRVLSVENVKSCVVLDNPGSLDDTTSVVGKTLPPHSLYVCVDGGTDEDVARAILDTKQPGCAYAGTGKTVSVTEAGQSYSVSFDIAEEVRIYVRTTVNVSSLGGTSVINIPQIKNAILAYANGEIEGVDGLELGVDVNGFEIASAITIQIPDLFIVSVEVSTDNTSWSTNATIAKYQKGTIDIDDITVTQQ